MQKYLYTSIHVPGLVILKQASLSHLQTCCRLCVGRSSTSALLECQVAQHIPDDIKLSVTLFQNVAGTPHVHISTIQITHHTFSVNRSDLKNDSARL